MVYKVSEIVGGKKILEVYTNRYPSGKKYISYKVECLNCHSIYTINDYTLRKKMPIKCKYCYIKPVKAKYKIGDIVNGKQILKIEVVKNNFQSVQKYTVKCLKCNKIIEYGTTRNLEGASPDYCKHCRKTYIVNGKTYYNLEDIAKDYNTSFKNISFHLHKYGNLDGLGHKNNSLDNPHYKNPKSIEVEYNGKKYRSQIALAQELGLSQTTVSEAYRMHDGDLSQVGKGHNSNYHPKAKYKVGDIVNGREIIAIKFHSSANDDNKGTGFTTKCLKCGNIAKVNGISQLETVECSGCENVKAPTAVILSTKPRPDRIQNLPKNIYYNKRTNRYEVGVSSTKKDRSGHKYFIRSYKTLEEAKQMVPVIKELALEYKHDI